MAMNNNQSSQRRKQQRHGISSNFIVDTHSITIEPSINNTKKLIAMSASRAQIKCLEQPVVSLYGMSCVDDYIY